MSHDHWHGGRPRFCLARSDAGEKVWGSWQKTLPKFNRVIVDKMQGGPTHFIAESHCAAKSWKNFSLKQRAGRS